MAPVELGVPASGVDSGVAWHYGDPLREQRQAVSAAAIVDRSNRGVLTVSGEDRLSWLDAICSQRLVGLGDGESAQALVLSPHGHVEQHWQVTELGGQVWLDVEPGRVAEVFGYLERMRFLKRVEPVDGSDRWAVLSLLGPRAGQVLRAAGLPAPEADAAEPIPAERAWIPADDTAAWIHADVPGGIVGTVPGAARGAARAARLAPGSGAGFVRAMPFGGMDLVVPRLRRAAVFAALRSAGAAAAGMWAFEALRAAARRPRLGLETDHRTIPHEVGWIGTAVHLRKGCYPGQEAVARVQNLGQPPRRLVLLNLSGRLDELPAPGAPVLLDGRAVGFVGTAAQHHELGPIALAVIGRTIADGATVTVAGDPAIVT